MEAINDWNTSRKQKLAWIADDYAESCCNIGILKIVVLAFRRHFECFAQQLTHNLAVVYYSSILPSLDEKWPND